MGCGDGRVDQCCGGDDINRPVAAGLAGDHMPQDHARDKKAAEADQAIGHKAQQAVVADDDAREEVQHIQAPDQALQKLGWQRVLLAGWALKGRAAMGMCCSWY